LGRCNSPLKGVSSEAEFALHRGPAEGLAKGFSSEAEIAFAARGLGGAPSSEAEIAFAVRGLGGAPSSEAEFALRMVRPRTGRTVVLGRGPSTYLGLSYLKRTWAECLAVFCVFVGVLVHDQGAPDHGTRQNELPCFKTAAAFYGDMESALRECAEDLSFIH